MPKVPSSPRLEDSEDHPFGLSEIAVLAAYCLFADQKPFHAGSALPFSITSADPPPPADTTHSSPGERLTGTPRKRHSAFSSRLESKSTATARSYSSRSIRFSTIFASLTESSTLQMIRGLALISSSRAVLTAAMSEAAISRAFFCRGSSGTEKAYGEVKKAGFRHSAFGRRLEATATATAETKRR